MNGLHAVECGFNPLFGVCYRMSLSTNYPQLLWFWGSLMVSFCYPFMVLILPQLKRMRINGQGY